MFKALTNSLVVLFRHCCATADILTKILQQCFLFFIVVVILGHKLGNSQVSFYRTIGPTLVTIWAWFINAIRELVGSVNNEELLGLILDP